MLRARRLALALEETIARGQPTASTEACIERAWAAWQLDGSTDRQIARVAQLVETAHGAIRSAQESQLPQAVRDVADVIWAGLPRTAKSHTSFEKLVQVVRGLRQDPDPWSAAVNATAKLLGWHDASRAHAAHAIRVALMTSRGG
jgi:hypothetical protein